jgi:hypothetical protein
MRDDDLERDDLERRGDVPVTRSGAVTAVAIVNFVLGGLSILCGLFVALLGGFLASLTSGGGGVIDQAKLDPSQKAALQQATAVSGLIIAVAIAVILVGVLRIVAGVGVIQRRQWGRILTLILGGLSAVLGILDFISGNPIGAVLDIAYAVFVFVVLLNAKFAAEFS